MDKAIYRIKKKILAQVYNLGEWHKSNYWERPYCMSVIQNLTHYLNVNVPNDDFTIVEVGCGIGDIIGNICVIDEKIKINKFGYDINANNIRIARWMYPKVMFVNGSFLNVDVEKIDCLIIINFIHTIKPEKLKAELDNIIEKRVKLILLDTFKNNKNTEYTYSHDGDYLFDKKYKMIKKSQGFKTSSGARRYIEYWRLKEETDIPKRENNIK